MARYKKLEMINTLMGYKQEFFNDIVSWLEAEKIIHKTEAVSLRITEDYNKAGELLRLLKKLESDHDDIQMIDYMWNVIPVEQIRLTIITRAEEKNYTYGME